MKGLTALKRWLTYDHTHSCGLRQAESPVQNRVIVGLQEEDRYGGQEVGQVQLQEDRWAKLILEAGQH